ncbi:hypothetical protein [Paenibacillus sp. BC26]|uniref:hypothetical protein n=1 Tax=Paenibacillus sp. BC26 TaxID=1881032 RepID=UPI0008E9D3CE|nr:hypothetical protein [Paenibacillus sp. BC26]SFT29440.1 hypothetical protein SAMN05428962_0094 [Paenibacillus sp. BC26]
MLREEKGSAFLLVVFMMLLFTLVGVAVLGATIGGAARTQKSEDNLQTVHLADKALSEAMAHIMARFDNQSISPSLLTQNVEEFVENFTGYEDGISELDEAKKPEYRIKNICILGTVNPLKQRLYCQNQSTATQSSTEDFLTTIRVTAEAEVNGVKRDLVQDMTLDTFPDFLKYAFGSEGDVVINGAPSFKGNIYAGDELLIQNVANYTYLNNPLNANTQFLYVDPVEDRSALDGIYVPDGDDLGNGKIQIQSQSKIKYRIDPQGTYQPLENLGDPQFHDLDSKVELTEKKKFLSIDVAQSFVDKAYDALGTGADPELREALWSAYTPLDSGDALMTHLKGFLSELQSISPITIPTAPTLPDSGATSEEQDSYNEAKADYDRAMTTLNTQFSNLSGAVFVEGDLTVGADLHQIRYTSKGTHDWLIVNGDLTIQNDGPNSVIPIRANILVKGKVTLIGDLEMDSTIFSLQHDELNEIMDAQIRGMVVNDKKRELVMIANGPIDIYRVTAFQPLGDGYKQSSIHTLDGFFYTDQTAELYGVGSLFWIHGGFFAKEGITINAVLGDTTSTETGNTLFFDPQDEGRLDQKHARFVIDYNKDVFINQLAGLPRVNKIRVNIGQKKLLPVQN